MVSIDRHLLHQYLVVPGGNKYALHLIYFRLSVYKVWNGNRAGMKTINEIWQRIEDHQGEVFYQKTGGEFRYHLVGNCLHPDRTNRAISKSQFEKAYKLVPLENTVPLQKLQGPSYLFAILMDRRIRGTDW